jgi:hypothetical protein
MTHAVPECHTSQNASRTYNPVQFDEQDAQRLDEEEAAQLTSGTAGSREEQQSPDETL